jgi:Tol biopolymer transport system component
MKKEDMFLQARQIMRREISWRLLLVMIVASGLLAACRGAVGQTPVAVSEERPALVYLSPVDAPEIWRMPAAGGEARQLTQTDGQVFDFGASRDGRWIAYAVENTAGGKDLWQLNTVSGESSLLLDCGEDSCFEASWSPDGTYLVYTRQQGGREAVWTVNRDSGESQPLIIDDTVPGRSPSWSPDGRRIAFMESQTGMIRIVDLEGEGNLRFSSTLGLMGSWSPDGKRMAYLDMAKDQIFAGVDVYVLDLESQQIDPLMVFALGDVDVSVPVWHPTEDLLLIAQRPLLGTYSKQLWLVRLGERVTTEALTADQNLSHGAYSWSPDGQQVVFQRFELEAPNATPQVWAWERESGQMRLIAENAALPAWLP